MNAYLSKSAERYAHDSKVRIALQKGQASWQEYVQSHCNAVWNVWRDGSIKNTMYLMCELSLVQNRTHVLWQSLLGYADSTPSLLPKPFPVESNTY